MKSLAVLLTIAIGASTAAAQQPPLPARDAPPAAQRDTGMIRGRVVRADTGEPLRRVQIRVASHTARELREPPATMTDDEGRYELAQLPPGR